MELDETMKDKQWRGRWGKNQ